MHDSSSNHKTEQPINNQAETCTNHLQWLKALLSQLYLCSSVTRFENSSEFWIFRNLSKLSWWCLCKCLLLKVHNAPLEGVLFLKCTCWELRRIESKELWPINLRIFPFRHKIASIKQQYELFFKQFDSRSIQIYSQLENSPFLTNIFP